MVDIKPGSKEWTQLTPEQKRGQRFNWFLNPEDVKFVSAEAEKNYKIRTQRLIDVFRVEEPDRVPVALSVGNIPLKFGGINYHTGMYDYDKAIEAYDKFNKKFSGDLDMFASLGILPGRALDIIDYKLYHWPGHGLPENATGFQYVEGEYMRDDEYDALILDPSDFWLRVYLPRAFGTFAPFNKVSPLTDIVEITVMPPQLMSLTSPEMQSALQNLIDIGKEMTKWDQKMGAFNRRGKEMGYASIGMSVFGKAPFDTLGDTLRGTRGIMKDMYSQPEKLLKALDVFAGLTIKSVINSANKTRNPVAFFPLHKGADGWMSQKQFETFYWPSLRKVINGVIEEGIVVSLFAEGGYNSRLEFVNEFPRGMVQWWFDNTDMARAKNILGGKCSIQGNVPVSLLVTGTPVEVKEYCRKLIEICGKGGGYILSAGASSDEAKLDNLQAMVAAAKEYGTYKK